MLQRVALSGFAVGGLVVGNAELTSQGVPVNIAAWHFAPPLATTDGGTARLS